MNQKANDLDKVVELRKGKLKVSNKREKINILTLTPESWSLRKTARGFKVSKTTARKARILREEKGILAVPQPVIGKRLSEKTVNSVLEFYQNDEYSRQLPGKKDCVSIGKNVHVSKRLILCNLKELYTAFKDKHPDLKISFSKFASLRPKWCITVGPKGTHSVCVCTAHQNVKLLLSSVNLSKDYHELLELIVCNRNSKEWMIHCCESCPGVSAVKKIIEGELMKADDDGQVDDYDDVEITFQQWTTSDRAELISCTLPLDEFIELLCEQLDEMASYS